MPGDLERVGARLRAARQAKGLTLEDVAARAGMSTSTLSRLESGKRQASLALLVPITRQLGIRIDDLVRPDSPDPRVRRAVIRRNGLVIAPLAPEDSPIETYRITYPPVAELPDLRVHDGFEWLYVLSGKLRLRLGEQDLVLSRGEAAEFDTRTPHAMSAAGQKPAEVLSIFNADGVRMHTHGAGASGGGSAG
ncbi:helix-turn-helix domain-containing protein [Microbacterium allomyrinae]|uniref:Helix-turn-helix transcriptional regulator n=1 Tax=Microbacterium allomyrinae TaxID=2830666 RepID=A0A9X1S2A6_9MICO|nr:XRE family transcriptional regulator [Microbacterium allomyrinae]MCC2031122.1 helix-turn-helix transcriptional regulator [Microbacterium allomyrinae]